MIRGWKEILPKLSEMYLNRPEKFTATETRENFFSDLCERAIFFLQSFRGDIFKFVPMVCDFFQPGVITALRNSRFVVRIFTFLYGIEVESFNDYFCKKSVIS